MRPQLYNAIDYLLHYKVGGQTFFSSTDMYIKSNIGLFLPWIKSIEEKYRNYPIVLSGEFGRIIGGNRQRILLPGGIRHRKVSQVHNPKSPFILIDDSFYSGRTLKAAEVMTGAKCLKAFTVYDGSKQKWEQVESLYRYYNWHNQK